jgi:Ser/Thr protein kinase RdoA (MazF antagonist)
MDLVPAQVLAHWGLERTRVQAIGNGLINRTFELVDEGGRRAILQQVNALFDPGIHHNIVAVTEHLARKAVATPRLLLTREGQAWAEHEGRVWRLQSAIEGVSFDALSGVEQARAAGEFVGRWHAALGDLEHEFVARRPGVHDTPGHLANLRAAVETCAGHPLFAEVEPLARTLLDTAAALDPMPETPERVAHGDLKISNLMFAGEQALALVDLDTVAPMILGFELGDAWRSWCNRATEDQPDASFDLALFEASLAGWQAGFGEQLSHEERHSLLLGPEWISLELACRFAADALFERYFGWNAAKFASRGAHNLARARGQWSLHQAVVGTRAQREALLSIAAAGANQDPPPGATTCGP